MLFLLKYFERAAKSKNSDENFLFRCTVHILFLFLFFDYVADDWITRNFVSQ